MILRIRFLTLHRRLNTRRRYRDSPEVFHSIMPGIPELAVLAVTVAAVRKPSRRSWYDIVVGLWNFIPAWTFGLFGGFGCVFIAKKKWGKGNTKS